MVEEKKFSSVLEAYNFIGEKCFRLNVEKNGDIYICRAKSVLGFNDNLGKSSNYYIDTNLPRNRKFVRRHLIIMIEDENLYRADIEESEHNTCNFAIFYSHGVIFTATVFHTIFVGGDPGEPFLPKNKEEKILFEDIKNGKIKY